MACAVSTEHPPASAQNPPMPFDLDAAWQVAPQVQIRPERFGALLYHFGTRQLSFLKSPALFRVVSSLGAQPSARAACRAASVPEQDLPSYRRALATLAASQMICLRDPA
jgi:putative mycofactocin binding protein MftB